jgi:hypothetical protein
MHGVKIKKKKTCNFVIRLVFSYSKLARLVLILTAFNFVITLLVAVQLLI